MARKQPKREPVDIDAVQRGDFVRIEAIGVVQHVHSQGRLDVKWIGSTLENSVDVALLTKVAEDELSESAGWMIPQPVDDGFPDELLPVLRRGLHGRPG